MNELEIFTYNSNEVKTTLINDEPYFNLKDICDILEIKNISDCKGRLNKKGVVTADTLTNGGIQKSNFINEANLYKVIFQSRKPQAEAFTDWVRDDDMTDEEKKQHPEYSVTGGFLKNIEVEGERQEWWDSLTKERKDSVMSLPNFDKNIFKEITGIDVNKFVGKKE